METRKKWAPWQLTPDSDPEQRWILVNGDDDNEEHPEQLKFATEIDARKYADA